MHLLIHVSDFQLVPPCPLLRPPPNRNVYRSLAPSAQYFCTTWWFTLGSLLHMHLVLEPSKPRGITPPSPRCVCGLILAFRSAPAALPCPYHVHPGPRPPGSVSIPSLDVGIGASTNLHSHYVSRPELFEIFIRPDPSDINIKVDPARTSSKSLPPAETNAH